MTDVKRGKVKIYLGELELSWNDLKEMVEYLEDNPANAPVFIVIDDQEFEAV